MIGRRIVSVVSESVLFFYVWMQVCFRPAPAPRPSLQNGFECRSLIHYRVAATKDAPFFQRLFPSAALRQLTATGAEPALELKISHDHTYVPPLLLGSSPHRLAASPSVSRAVLADWQTRPPIVPPSLRPAAEPNQLLTNQIHQFRSLCLLIGRRGRPSSLRPSAPPPPNLINF